MLSCVGRVGLYHGRKTRESTTNGRPSDPPPFSAVLSIPSSCSGPCGPQVHLLGARLAQAGGQSASLGRLCPAGPRNVKDEACGPESRQTVAEAAPGLRGGGGHTVGPPAGFCTQAAPRGRPCSRVGRSPAGPVGKRGMAASQDGHRRAVGTKCRLRLSQGGGEAPAESASNSNVSPHTPGERVSPAHEGTGLGQGPARGSGFLLESHTLVTSLQSLLSLCDPMDCSTPGLPVHRQLPEFSQLMSIESVMPSNHLILCRPLLPPSIFPSIRVFSNESALRIKWPKHRGFSFSIGPSNEYSGLISFRIDWFHLLAEPRESQESSPRPV